MKITAIQLVVALIFTAVGYAADASAQGVLERRINLTIDRTSLKQALQQIGQTAGVKFIFNSKLIRSNEAVSFTARN